MAELASPEQLRARLSRIEGQIRGIAKMLESDRACEDVVTQLMAVRSGIDTVGALVLDLHLGNCIGCAESTERVELLRDSMRRWWRFAPGAAGFAVGGLDDTGAPATTAEDVPQA
jgi:DNA-binding FrmR family transcriptional regulator